MPARRIAHCTALFLVTAVALAAQAPATAPVRVLVHAGRLIDGIADEALRDQGILIEDGRIVAVGSWKGLSPRQGNARVIDLSGMTVLPGLIDAHTHLLLQGDITQEEYDEQVLKESIPYRALRGAAAAHTALMNGFTTLRDLETEGAMYADVDLKRAFARGVLPGPRLFVATRAFSACSSASSASMAIGSASSSRCSLYDSRFDVSAVAARLSAGASGPGSDARDAAGGGGDAGRWRSQSS